jgi:hypothetical protein
MMPFPIIEDTKRPFRIWDNKAKKHCIGRNYAYERNALNAALIMVRWAKVGESLTVYNVTNGKPLGTYLLKPTSIFYTKG